MTKQNRKVELQDLTEDTRHVYVLNSTRRTKSVIDPNITKNRTDVVLSVPDSSGTGMEIVTIPDTWIALDLLNQVSVKQLLSSRDFRSFITKGFIVLISDEFANEINADESYSIEVERLRGTQRGLKTVPGHEVDLDEVLRESRGEQKSYTKPTAENDSEEDLEPRISLLCDRIKASSSGNSEDVIKEDEIINTLKTLASSAEEADWRHIRETAKVAGLRSVVSYVNSKI